MLVALEEAVKRLRRIVLVVLLLALMPHSLTQAQAPQKQRAFVYGLNAALALGFNGTFAPPSASTIYVLAGRTSILSPRITEIYFWPITNEYQADWSTVNEPVLGTLEVVRQGQPIQTLQPTAYTIHYPMEGLASDAALFLGEAAVQANDAFRARQAQYVAESQAYAAAQQAWQALVVEANAKREQGETVTLPPAPTPPAPIGVMSNGLNEGFALHLEPGTYSIQVRAPDGTIVPDSQRTLVAFTARREAVGYTALPEARWTMPERAPDPDAVIVGALGSTVYLQPLVTREYPTRAYTLLQNPQALGTETSSWTWIDGEPLTDAQLEVLDGARAVSRAELQPYRVQQLAGEARGYEVVPYMPNAGTQSPPDFLAYPIRLTPELRSFSVRLVMPNGQPIENSTRLVRVASQVALVRLLALAVIPLAFAVYVVQGRRRRMRLPRDAQR